MVIANLGKRTISRLRPNFLAVCQPNLTELCPPGMYDYITEYTCYGIKNPMDEFFRLVENFFLKPNICI